MHSVSDLILKKGPLSSVWIAGTSTDKLGKKMVLATDIATLAKQIMEEERVNLVLRLSGMLLKGLVVVYSKKMQYMLTDCEDVISKIKLSFKPGQIDLTGKNSKEETITITTDISDLTIEPVDLAEWAKTANPEEYFVVQHPTISFQTPEPSQAQTDDSAATSSFSSQIPETPIKFNFDNESLGNSTRPTARQTPARNVEVPETTWDDVDDIPIPGDDEPMPDMRAQSETEATTEPDNETEEEKTKRKKLIIDNQTMLSNNRRTTRRTRRTVTSEAAPQVIANSQLDSLFAESRKLGRDQSDKETNRNAPDEDFESDMGPGLGGFDSDAEVPEVEQNRSARVPQSSENDILPMPSDNDIILGSDRNKGSDDEDQMRPIEGMPRPVLTPLASPYPNLKFVVEETPRRTAEDSFTTETINTLNKFREVLRGKEEEKTTFSETFSGSSRRAAARAFYQMLVLKSTGQIDVKQQEPFGEIEITPGKQFWTT
ncbi:N terminus of Rad21 / Rec8 like protein [Trichomonas vaginalis G3]|uniref:N terminus of Rad21 / Rec8 like protein n=2 Tax=Trichomonas vaginalis TaxID=5722 RepID=A2DRE9_TRIV3|nr:sister chromatid cohesion [Trichomonas vaginalis G3]EAY17075.1 N terminus of Rad21 / Rec8 like protein [Trichomonas vaginalis G3]KAI5517947.1 sister chromatid cohesion [Trichomonas vaginalis G3]|eukprot:XP_001329298.1 N terminus of Rad21 / Rec8 like protein [Trichomonas vaginalis G3]